MGRSGTDVAREAADLVLLDDDFATIVAAVEQGRATFSNIRRFLTYHLTDNVAELTPFVVWALSGGRFPLALGVLQILALDIGTDMLPALALGAEPPDATCPGPAARRRDTCIDRRAAAPASSACSARPRPSWRWPRSSSRSSPPAGDPGDSFPTGRRPAGRLRRRVHRRGPRPGGQRLRLPQRHPLARRARLDDATGSCSAPSRSSWSMLAGFLFIPPVADLLDQAPPPAAGFAVALLAAPGRARRRRVAQTRPCHSTARTRQRTSDDSGRALSLTRGPRTVRSCPGTVGRPATSSHSSLLPPRLVSQLATGKRRLDRTIAAGE